MPDHLSHRKDCVWGMAGIYRDDSDVSLNLKLLMRCLCRLSHYALVPERDP